MTKEQKYEQSAKEILSIVQFWVNYPERQLQRIIEYLKQLETEK
jgi:hypothetical protein